MELLTEQHLREMVYGGAVLGAGGGGSIRVGLTAGYDALDRGKPRLARVEELQARSLIVTLSTVGSVAGMAESDNVKGRHIAALRRLAAFGDFQIDGLIASEVGPAAAIYGWAESAVAGIPIVDAPCNGRAHPLGLMGSLGLHRFPRYITTTVAIGGKGKRLLELSLKANVSDASRVVRQNAAMSAIPLAVARNPLPLSYVRRHAAIGALRHARQIGKVLLTSQSEGIRRVIEGLSRCTGGRLLAEGRVQSVRLEERGGFTVGNIILVLQNGGEAVIPVCNEYMALLRNGSKLAVFPDVITVFDAFRRLPLSSNEVRQQQSVVVFGIPRQRLHLSSSMKDEALLRPIEKLLNLRLRKSVVGTTVMAKAEKEPA
jgi:DUF917 family protein